MRGGVTARHNLGHLEKIAGNMNRALKHFTIAAEGGYEKSVKNIKELYSNGHASKNEYAHVLRAYQVYLGEIKSAQRDEAAAVHASCRYY